MQDYTVKPKRQPKKIAGRQKKSFLSGIFPQKGDSKGEIIRKIIFIVAFVVLVGTIIVLSKDFIDFWFEEQKNNDISNKFTANLGETSTSGSQTDSAGTGTDNEPIEYVPIPDITVDFDGLKAINPAVVGWIKIPGTMVDHPVVQAPYDEPEYYIDHNIYKEESKSGAIYAYHKNTVVGDDPSDNIILQGHNMRNGDFFGFLDQYYPYATSTEDPLAFYRTNPMLNFNTPDETARWKIFAGVLYNTQKKYGEVYNYIGKRDFSSQSSFNNFIGDVLDRSMFYTDVDIQYGDQILTLSTCDYPLGDDVDTRWVLYARKLRDGEDPNIDVNAAYVNNNPLMFDYYYQVWGTEWYGRRWDTSKLIGYEE